MASKTQHSQKNVDTLGNGIAIAIVCLLAVIVVIGVLLYVKKPTVKCEIEQKKLKQSNLAQVPPPPVPCNTTVPYPPFSKLGPGPAGFNDVNACWYTAYGTHFEKTATNATYQACGGIPDLSPKLHCPGPNYPYGTGATYGTDQYDTHACWYAEDATHIKPTVCNTLGSCTVGETPVVPAPGHAHHAHLAPSHAHLAPSHAHLAPSHAHLAPSHAHLAPSHAHLAPSHAHLAPSHAHHAHLAPSHAPAPSHAHCIPDEYYSTEETFSEEIQSDSQGCIQL